MVSDFILSEEIEINVTYFSLSSFSKQGYIDLEPFPRFKSFLNFFHSRQGLSMYRFFLVVRVYDSCPLAVCLLVISNLTDKFLRPYSCL
jgi:hypothetical protein